MTLRPNRERWLLKMASDVSLRGTCSRLYVGAVIARDSRIISTGYNGAPAGQLHCDHRPDEDHTETCQWAVHAEANALVFAARHGAAVEGTELFCTHQPCLECAKLIINAGIVRVVFDQPYRLRAGLDLLESSNVATMRLDPWF